MVSSLKPGGGIPGYKLDSRKSDALNISSKAPARIVSRAVHKNSHKEIPPLARIQKKINISSPSDRYEQEADDVSKQIVGMSAVDNSQGEQIQTSPTKQVQRVEGEDATKEDETSLDETAAPWPELEEGELEALDKVQRKADDTENTHAQTENGLVQRIQQPAGGRPLPTDTRNFMEPRFKEDFSEVRVHDSSQDQQDAAALKARAFTYGKHIWLSKNSSTSDKPLMAHELTHVVQQSGGSSNPASKKSTGVPPEISSKNTISAAPSHLQRKEEESTGFWGRAKSFVSERLSPKALLKKALVSAGGFGKRVAAILDSGKGVFDAIVSNPLGFVNNLVAALRKGFRQFSGNIGKHLKTGLLQWMFGALAKTGISLPPKFNLKGIASLIFQIFGLTYANLRGKLVKVMGEDRVSHLETTLDFLKTLVREGLSGAWEQLKNTFTSLKEKAISSVKEWAITTLIQKAVLKLVSMFNPAGALLQAGLAIYNTVSFFIERLDQIKKLANSVFNSISKIVSGKIGAAANFIENTMANSLSIIIGFLAKLIGLGGISKKIKEIIKRLREPVDKAINRLVNMVVRKANGLLSKAKSGTKKVFNWLKEKAGFKTKSGEKHSIFIDGTENNARVMIASEPQTYREFIQNLQVSPQQQEIKEKAIKTARELDKAISAAATNTPKAKNKNAVNPATGITNLINQLAAETAPIMPKEQEGSTIKSTKPIYGGKVKGFGSSVNVLHLGPIHDEGSSPSVSNEQWSILARRRLGNGIFYVRGHLLNEQLGGPGNTWSNLTPITQKANSDHKLNFENTVKKAVNGGIGDYKKPKNAQANKLSAVTFNVSAEYGGLSRNTLIKSLRDSGSEDDLVRANIIEAEEFVPNFLHCTATKINADGKPGENLVSHSVNVTETIHRHPDSYKIRDSAIETIYLSGRLFNKDKVMRLNGMTPEIAETLDNIKNNPLRSWSVFYKKTGTGPTFKNRLFKTSGANIRLFSID